MDGWGAFFGAKPLAGGGGQAAAFALGMRERKFSGRVVCDGIGDGICKKILTLFDQSLAE